MRPSRASRSFLGWKPLFTCGRDKARCLRTGPCMPSFRDREHVCCLRTFRDEIVSFVLLSVGSGPGKVRPLRRPRSKAEKVYRVAFGAFTAGRRSGCEIRGTRRRAFLSREKSCRSERTDGVETGPFGPVFRTDGTDGFLSSFCRKRSASVPNASRNEGVRIGQ